MTPNTTPNKSTRNHNKKRMTRKSIWKLTPYVMQSMLNEFADLSNADFSNITSDGLINLSLFANKFYFEGRNGSGEK